MALHTKIIAPFGDGDYVFDVGPLGIRLELEEKCSNTGLLGIHRRLQNDCRIMDYRETIRLGLIGGGMKPLDALRMVKRYVELRPSQESVPLAMMILMAGLVGVEEAEEKKDDPPLGKPQAETALTGKQPVSPSAGPSSTKTAQPSVSRPARSTPSRTGNSSSASKDGTTSTVPVLKQKPLPTQNSTPSSKPTPNGKP